MSEDYVIEKKDIVLTIKPNKRSDADDVHFYIAGDTSKSIGYGFKSKQTGTIHIVRCPQCGRENWASGLASGRCSFCGYNPNESMQEATKRS